MSDNVEGMQNNESSVFNPETYNPIPGLKDKFASMSEDELRASLNPQLKIARVVKREDGYHVLSEEGKNLGGPYKSKGEADKRLQQVEYFKHKGGSVDLKQASIDKVAKDPLFKSRLIWALVDLHAAYGGDWNLICKMLIARYPKYEKEIMRFMANVSRNVESIHILSELRQKQANAPLWDVVQKLDKIAENGNLRDKKVVESFFDLVTAGSLEDPLGVGQELLAELQKKAEGEEGEEGGFFDTVKDWASSIWNAITGVKDTLDEMTAQAEQYLALVEGGAVAAKTAEGSCIKCNHHLRKLSDGSLLCDDPDCECMCGTEEEKVAGLETSNRGPESPVLTHCPKCGGDVRDTNAVSGLYVCHNCGLAFDEPDMNHCHKCFEQGAEPGEPEVKAAARVVVPKDHPVQPLKPGENPPGKMTCGTCGLSWDDDKPTSWTPVPSGRCPFEYFHVETPEPVDRSMELGGTAAKVAADAVPQKPMDLNEALSTLAQLAKAQEYMGQRMAEVQKEIEAKYQISQLQSKAPVAQQRVMEGLKELKTAQRRFEGVIFRIREVTKRKSFRPTEFMELLRGLFKGNDVMQVKINELEAQATTPQSKEDRLEVQVQDTEPVGEGPMIQDPATLPKKKADAPYDTDD